MWPKDGLKRSMRLAVRDALHWANAIVRTAPMAPDPDERFVANPIVGSESSGGSKQTSARMLTGWC
jgi:hypothetical protein